MARILNRKSATEEQKRFLEVISKETARLDKVLEDLSNYAEQFGEMQRELLPLCDTLRKTLMLVGVWPALSQASLMSVFPKRSAVIP